MIAFSGVFVPALGDRWTLFSGGFDTADFASITLPADTALSGYDLVTVPEPTTGFLTACGAVAVACRLITSRRRRETL